MKETQAYKILKKISQEHPLKGGETAQLFKQIEALDLETLAQQRSFFSEKASKEPFPSFAPLSECDFVGNREDQLRRQKLVSEGKVGRRKESVLDGQQT